jgi:hypothetical protein
MNNIELTPVLKQEHIIEILRGIIDDIEWEKMRDYDANSAPGPQYKQKFLRDLKIPVEIKVLLGYRGVKE